MRLEQLSYLVEISKTKSISLAAERMYISQPSLSEAINKLEKELGVTLLQRSHRGVDLTEDGAKVVEASEQILGIVDELKSELEIDTKVSQLTGKLSVSATPDLSSTILIDTVNAFSKKYPNVSLNVKAFDILDVIQDVADGKADLGLIPMLADYLPNNRLTEVYNNEIHFERLFSTKLVCLVGKHSPLASKKDVSIKEIVSKHSVVFYSTNSANYWFSQLLDRYGEPNICLKSSNVELVEKTVVTGTTVCLSTRFYYERGDKQSLAKNPNIIPIPIKEDIRLSTGWIRLIGDQPSKIAQEFIRISKSLC